MVNFISNFPSKGQKDIYFLSPTNSSSLSIVVTQLLSIWISYPLLFLVLFIELKIIFHIQISHCIYINWKHNINWHLLLENQSRFQQCWSENCNWIMWSIVFCYCLGIIVEHVKASSHINLDVLMVS
jgi:hypothetical protein